MKKITHEEYIHRLNLANPSIEVIGQFKGMLSPIRVRCPNSHEWEPIANSILRAAKNNRNGYGCATCSGRKKRTHEEFVAELNALNPNIQVEGIFQAVDKKVDVKCKKCGNLWSTTGNSLLRKSGCMVCGLESSKLKQRKSIQQFEFDASNASPNIEILGKYINAKTHLKCRCRVCAHQWEITPSNLLKGRGCPRCSGSLTMSNDEFIEKLRQVQPNIEVLGEYSSNKSRAPCRCKVCNWEWNPPLYRLLKGRGCPNCAGVPDITHEIFSNRVALQRSDLTLLGKFTGMRKRIGCKCTTCSHEWDAPAQHIWKGTSGCPVCGYERSAEASRKSNQDFLRDFHENNLDADKIKLHSEYINSTTRMDAECLTCGHRWAPIASSLIRGSGCPICNTAGYDIRKPGIFYLYEISYLGDIYLGFGISNQYIDRERTHFRNLNEHSGRILEKYLYRFEDGKECLELETQVKQQVKVSKQAHNLGIEGFITECAKYSAMNSILRLVDESNGELCDSEES